MTVIESEDSFTGLQKLKQEDNHKKSHETLPICSYCSQEYKTLRLITPTHHLFLLLYHIFGKAYEQSFHLSALLDSHSILPVSFVETEQPLQLGLFFKSFHQAANKNHIIECFYRLHEECFHKSLYTQFICIEREIHILLI